MFALSFLSVAVYCLPGVQITGLMVALLFAGQHTSSITSTWTALHIIQNPALLCVLLRAESDYCSCLFFFE